MKYKLKQIAEIQAGYSFRSRLEPDLKGGVRVIQMKDLNDENIVSCEKLIRVSMETSKVGHFVKKGDLFFRSRGSQPSSAVLLEEIEKAVVAAPLLRIRLKKPETVLPEYLNWYISQHEAQNFLKSRATGSMQMMIGIDVLEQLEIPVPDTNVQKAVVELARLAEQEQQLMQKMAKKREHYLSRQLMQLVNENN